MGESFGEFVREQRATLPIIPTPAECEGKTFIVTGANVGLGYECAKHLVRLGSSRVIIAVRSLSKGEAAKTAIEESTGVRGVADVWHLDLSSFDSVKTFVKKAETLDRIDAVIQNAGVAMGERVEAEGLDTTLTVNVISTLLLAALIMPKLQACAKQFGTTPHMVLVGSNVAFRVPGVLEKLAKEGDIIDAFNALPHTMQSYPVSKLLLFYAFRTWASQRPVSQTGVVINYVNPGLCWSELSRNAPFLMRTQIKIMRYLLARTTEVGSRTELHAAFIGSDGHGKYLSGCEIKEQSVPDWTLNESGKDIQERVWKSVTQRLNRVQSGCI